MKAWKQLTPAQQMKVVENLEDEVRTPEELDDAARDLLEEVHGFINICGGTYSAIRALRDVDPVAYQEAINNTVDAFCKDEGLVEIIVPLPYLRTRWVNENELEKAIDSLLATECDNDEEF